jgi:hypothetical protein
MTWPAGWSLDCPTAQASRAEVAATSLRMLYEDAGLGLGTRVHAVPFHRSTRVRTFPAAM